MIKARKRVSIRARVIDTSTFFGPKYKVGDEVILTRDDRDVDGTIATDEAGSFGVIGEAYELIEDG